MSSRHLVVGLAVLVLAIPAHGQGTLPYHGSELLRFALHTKELKPVSTAQDALRSPRATMIVVFGEIGEAGLHFSETQLRTFLVQGGAILVATDRATTGPFGWEHEFGFSISGQSLTADPADCYLGVESRDRRRPFVRPFGRPGNLRRPSPLDLFEDVPESGPTAIATERPSELRLRPDRWGFARTPLAEYPRTARGATSRQPVPANTFFAASWQTQIGPGRMLVVADQSVFANGLMGFEEDESPRGFGFNNGNWDFTNRTIEWLRAGPLELRTKCLFIEDGEIIDKFADELPKPPRPPIPDIPPDVLANILLNHSNGVINELQEKNFFNRAMEGFFGFPRIVRGFLIAATLLFLYFGLRWLMRGQRKAEPAALTGPAQHAALLPRGGVLRQRTAAQIEVGNLSEAAGRRVRDRFDVLGGRPGPDGDMPPLLVAIDISDAPALKQTVRWLWEIGYGDAPVNVPPVEWDRVNSLLERVTARAARGDWSFGQDAS